MSPLSALGARALPATYHANSQPDGKSTGVPGTLKTATPAASPLTLSSDALDMQKRAASLGNATVDFAQDLMSSFSQALFGDDAKGATIDFDTASLESSSSYALGVAQSAGPNGSTSLAGFSLSDSSHFIGKGTITTADGRKFDFEVEVQYDAKLSAAAGQRTSGAAPKAEDTAQPSKAAGSTIDLPTVRLPNIDFAGTLADLFQLIGRDLQTALSSDNKSESDAANGIDHSTLRGLSLRLLNLVNSKDANTYSAPTAADQAKSASAYDAQAAQGDPVPAAAPATAPEASAARASDGQSVTA